ncbi:MAG: hypothetical protein DDG59_02790, partial [Anaerolineae bacterium]
MGQSLRSRIAYPIVILLIVIMIVGGVAITLYFNHLYLDSIYKNLLSSAKLLANLLGKSQLSVQSHEVANWSDIL